MYVSEYWNNFFHPTVRSLKITIIDPLKISWYWFRPCNRPPVAPHYRRTHHASEQTGWVPHLPKQECLPVPFFFNTSTPTKANTTPLQQYYILYRKVIFFFSKYLSKCKINISYLITNKKITSKSGRIKINYIKQIINVLHKTVNQSNSRA